MTTIVYRDGTLAADTAVYDRGCYCGETVKIVRSTDGWMGGATGYLGDSARIKEWILRGSCTDTPPEISEHSEGLLISPDGVVEWIGPKWQRSVMAGRFFAAGSGFRIAMGAMAAGASAEEAVMICAELDDSTRYPITVLRLKEG